MCGITGWVDWDRDLNRERPILEQMTQRLAHRGPDAAGLWTAEHAALGHRRLVVVDPAGGAQPMQRARNGHSFAMVYNGELYNTAELRQDLTARGYTFASQSDTEVLLVAYMEWGAGCLERLNGIFAFAVWDEAQQSLFLARDRLGIKPLFWARRGSAFLFGSELKALLAHPLVEPALDAEGLAEVLFLGPSRTPGHGVFQGVSELLPGTWLRHSREGTRTGTYWQLQSLPHPHNLQETVAAVRDLFVDSVRRQLISDVPIATLLSGGLDSSAITAVAAGCLKAQQKAPLLTWSVDYRENDRFFQSSSFQPDADAPWIRQVSAALGTRHREVLIDTDELVDALDDAMRARDLPGMADIDASLYLFCRRIKEESTVVLSGECADELFGGYPWYYREPDLWQEGFPWLRRVAQRTRLFRPEVVAATKPAEYVTMRLQESLDEVPRLPAEDALAARRREISYLNLRWFMANLLDRKDRMSMAAGVEARVPFCDHRLVEYVWNIPAEFKMAGGREKGILREAVAGLLPPDVLQRRKSPYPKTHHPAYDQAVRRRLASILDDPAAPIHQLVDSDAVQQWTASRPDSGSTPWYGQLMGDPQMMAFLIQLNTWLKEYRVVFR